jgi:hypothetical protein
LHSTQPGLESSAYRVMATLTPSITTKV